MLPARQIFYEVHGSTAPASLNEFRSRFQAMYQESPVRAIRFFLYYVAARGNDATSQAMAFWATSGTLYLTLLLDGDSVGNESFSLEMATQALGLLGQFDTQFFFKFAHLVAGLSKPDDLLRALQLAPGLGDYSILLAWLRSLEKHSDSRVRARAAKLICQLRPNKGNIERHLQSNDGRVRAAALEALWEAKIRRGDADTFQFFRSALSDSHHRVVANALVGLYRLGEQESIYKMISFSNNKQHLFRAAMAWAMGVVEDTRAIPILETLKADRSYTVRQRAEHSLSTLVSHSADWRGSDSNVHGSKLMVVGRVA